MIACNFETDDFSAWMQTVLSVPKLGMLVAMLVTDIKTSRKGEQIFAATLRYLGYTLSTCAQFLEGFLDPNNPGLSIGKFQLDPLMYAKYYVMPVYAAWQATTALAQNLLLWLSTGVHRIRLITAMIQNMPFLN
jgi:hypothetical protein